MSYDEAELLARSLGYAFQAGTMLVWEFYTLNTTATLLWLCERIDHTVLLGLIALGAVCVLVCLCVLASSLVSFSLSIARTIISTSLDIILPGENIPPVCSWSSSYVLRPGQGLCDPSNAIRDAALAHLAPADNSLTLPQSLALNPDQWPELRSRSPSLASELMPPSRPSESHEKRSALRRSQRQQRNHTTSSV